ncbi:hypothetical protein RUM43_010682 [Polyplax serrata]|uniref:Uncharacterized protein n=1 Tax=Polyplax serrata TaxID=468196 RepID=A0AAN8PKV1_POLSC
MIENRGYICRGGTEKWGLKQADIVKPQRSFLAGVYSPLDGKGDDPTEEKAFSPFILLQIRVEARGMKSPRFVPSVEEEDVQSGNEGTETGRWRTWNYFFACIAWLWDFHILSSLLWFWNLSIGPPVWSELFDLTILK